MGGGVVSMVAVLTRLREATARIARLLGIRTMRNALRAQEGGQHYDCAAQICRKRARPPAMRRTPSIAAKAVGNRARGLYRRDAPHVARYNCTKRRIMTRRLRIFNQTRLSMLRRSSAALGSLRPQAAYGACMAQHFMQAAHCKQADRMD